MDHTSDNDDDIKIEESRVRSVMASFDDLLQEGKRFVSVTEWANGEGFDVDIEGHPMFTLTFSEADALRKVLGIHLGEE